MRKYLPQFSIFVFGFVSAATEMIVVRQLMPIIGSTTFITSLIFAFSILGLALGYYLAHKCKRELFASKAIAMASIFLGLGLSYPLVYLFFSYAERVLHTNLALLLFATLVVMPIFAVLGFMLSSARAMIFLLGAACGALLSTVLFMGWLGMPWTIIICTALLLSTIIFQTNILSVKHSVIAGILLAFVTMFNLMTEDPNTIATNTYANYRRIDNTAAKPFSAQPGKSLVINNSSSSFVEYKSLKGYPYVEMIKKIIFDDLKLRNKDILVLGAGGFTITAAGTYQNNITYVDVDPKLERIVQEHYLSNTNGKFIGADARSFLRTNRQGFDVIIGDTFAEKVNIPTHLSTKEYYELIEQNLNPEGIAIFNTIITPSMRDQFSQQTDNTIRSAFKSCMVIPYQYGEAIANVLYVCRKNHPDRTAAIYSDHQHHKLSDIAAVNSGMSVNRSPTKP